MNAQATTPSELEPAAGASPVMAQYFEAKARQPDALVFFRMGDFYELFFEDAQKAAAALGITLTARGQHGGAPIPMAGVPAHAAEAYLAKLIRAGFKVAVCDQLEDPAEAKKRGSKAVVRREVTRVVTPGTLTEDGRGFLGVLEEQLEEVAHAEEHQRVGLAGLGLEILRHHRRGARGVRGVGHLRVHGSDEAKGRVRRSHPLNAVMRTPSCG